MARIVLIDDEARLLQTLARFLEQQGHHVVRGGSFREVESHLWPGRFELLVSDIVMPDFDGIKVLREVVEVRQCQEPVVLITGEPNLETASEAVRRGAFDYISKPVTKDKLLEAVSRGLRHVHLLRERDLARQTEMQVLKNLASLGESASVLSHEIRTPITSLRHALRAVGDKLGVEDRVLVEEFVGNLNRIERMLGQTLSFAKPLHLQRQPTELEPLLAAAVRETATLPMAATMQMVVEAEPGATADVDPQLFGEVVTNLLRNAAEACQGQGRITVRCRRAGERVTIEVEDDGPGVPASLRGEIFRPFRSSKDYGTGIGLAFCRKVVESHGGTIELADRPGPGACFRIDLPVHPTAAAPYASRERP
jgi:signal transduction histidine kinase